jgi:hypothetical protein
LLINIAQQSNTTLTTALVQFHTGYSQIDHNDALSNTPLQARDHPDQNFYEKSNWAHSLIYLVVTYAFAGTLVVLTYGGLAQDKMLALMIPAGANFISYFPVYTVLSIWILIMLSILLEDIGYAQKNVLRSFMGITCKRYILGCRLLLFGSSLCGTLLSILRFGDYMVGLMLCANVVMYCVLSVVAYFTTVRHGNAF